jgi:hypothetical protein
MTTHILKTAPEYFEMLWAGEKHDELRENDRDYQVGDELVLKPTTIDEHGSVIFDNADGREIRATITHIIHGTPLDGDYYVAYALMSGYVLLCLKGHQRYRMAPYPTVADIGATIRKMVSDNQKSGIRPLPDSSKCEFDPEEDTDG